MGSGDYSYLGTQGTNDSDNTSQVIITDRRRNASVSTDQIARNRTIENNASKYCCLVCVSVTTNQGVDEFRSIYNLSSLPQGAPPLASLGFPEFHAISVVSHLQQLLVLPSNLCFRQSCLTVL